MRFRATVEHIPIFFRCREATKEMHHQVYRGRDAHHLQRLTPTKVASRSGLKVESLFTNYRIQSNAENKITVSLSTEALLSALRSSSSSASSSSIAAAILPTYDADELVMKLAKKHDTAVLSFEMLGVSRSGRKLQKMRTIVERLRPLSDVLVLRANNSGKLQLAISTDTVKLETQWVGCTNPSMRHAPDQNAPESEVAPEDPDPEKLFSVYVSIRSFIKFLNSHVVSTTTIACICQNHCAILYVYIGDVADAGGVLTFYIPIVIDDVN
ncbi:cell cycle checkpoint [Butyriboletus roseoflavus]|nr:cell cycle checkpoint [Butyriboletus roseoflavus]